MSDLLPLSVGLSLAVLLMALAYKVFRPEQRLGEPGRALEARILAHEWALHAGTGLFFCGALVMLTPVIAPQSKIIGGALVGVLSASIACLISRPPAPIRFDDKWILSHPFASSFAAHALAGVLMSLLVAEPVDY